MSATELISPAEIEVLNIVNSTEASEQEIVERVTKRERAMVRVNVLAAIHQGNDLDWLHEKHKGHWREFCQEYVGMSKRTADRYRAVARLAMERGTHLSHASRITWTAWLELIKKSTPVAVIERSLEEAKTEDKVLTAQRVKTLVSLLSKRETLTRHKTKLTLENGVRIVVDCASEADVLSVLKAAIHQLEREEGQMQEGSHHPKSDADSLPGDGPTELDQQRTEPADDESPHGPPKTVMPTVEPRATHTELDSSGQPEGETHVTER